MGLFEPGRNCWRVEKAERATVIVDACDYYRVIRQAMLEAKKRILIIGWDFDPRIKLDRTEEANSEETLGQFLLDLAKAKPDVPILILKWNVGALKTLFRGAAILWVLRLAWQKSISFKLDGVHPVGASHHQKIVVIDDRFAICGGIDMTGDRWDRSAHEDGDPDRIRPNGEPYGPWHDATMAVDGPLAAAIGELACDRWQRATGDRIGPVENAERLWPDGLQPQFRDVELAIARTSPCYRDWPAIDEVEQLFLDMLRRAKHFIYIETQYFTSPKLAAAIAERMEEPDPPEIVLVGPIKAEGWLEQVAMDATRVRLAQIIGRSDTGNRFRIFTPKTEAGDDIYVHAKIMIVDDRILRVGSSNMNNRSLGLDSECDLVLEAGNDAEIEQIAAFRSRLMAEHLGVEEAVVARTFAETGSLLRTIETLQHPGRTLKLLPVEEPSDTSRFIAETELLDPKSPDAMFEQMTRRSLFDPLRRFRRRGRLQTA